MHRPGIATVIQDKIVLNGTTIEEVKKYHRDTLIMCVEDSNSDYKRMMDKKIEDKKKEQSRINEFEESLKRNIDDITF
ncbi:hypothetical protein B5C08_01845 [Staphylococcus delphini]|uniref:Uncharacterized protein n=2 Tax=Staphylococcus delphini TaxID=53344 RepID=A0A2A4GZ18_9STAP|nr:hypothetical protein [Staphylococcus delphini]PCF56803.1 hypothetical protein B5C08_01845 [Staphylococcus delphini]